MKCKYSSEWFYMNSTSYVNKTKPPSSGKQSIYLRRQNVNPTKKKNDVDKTIVMNSSTRSNIFLYPKQ